MKNRELAHISTVVRPAGRRILDAHPTRTTWCGAEPTAADVAPADARRWVATAWTQGPARCETCFGLLLDRDFARSSKVED